MLIEQYTAESAEVTAAMATQGHKLFKGANIIIACTGLLKPGGSASSEKPVGTFLLQFLITIIFMSLNTFWKVRQ